jgi:hypothetical protein
MNMDKTTINFHFSINKMTNGNGSETKSLV